MSDVIEFLERVGQDGSLRHASRATLAEALQNARIDPRLSAALIRGDKAEVEAVLGSRNVCLMVWAPAPDPEEEAQQKAA